MFVIFLKFAANRDRAKALMEGHKAWLAQGFDDGVFLLAGSLMPNAGGCILAHGVSRAELEVRVKEDPFVAENVVTAEIMEIDPSKADPRLAFLLG